MHSKKIQPLVTVHRVSEEREQNVHIVWCALPVKKPLMEWKVLFLEAVVMLYCFRLVLPETC